MRSLFLALAFCAAVPVASALVARPIPLPSQRQSACNAHANSSAKAALHRKTAVPKRQIPAKHPLARAVPPFRFVVYGDTRDGHDVHRQLVALMLRERPALVLQTGDLVHHATNADEWKIYDSITGELHRKIPFYPSRGNHDLGPEYEKHVPDGVKPNKLYYSFNASNCHFVCLDIDTQSDHGPKSAQYQWLEKDLAAAHRKTGPIFVFFHAGPYSIGSHGSDLSVRKDLCPLFEKYGVRIVFTGHDHIFYHTLRNGVHYVVTGGGGAPLYDLHPETKGAIPGDTYEKANHLIICDVRGNSVRVMPRHADDTPLGNGHGKTFDFTVTAP